MKALPGLWVYFSVLPGHIPTQNLGKLPPPGLSNIGKLYMVGKEISRTLTLFYIGGGGGGGGGGEGT